MPKMTAEVSAPPTPCTKRAATSTSWLCAKPHASEARVNPPKPVMKIVFLPIKSPKRPASRSRPPKAIRYALITHARLDCVKPRSVWIEGNATFTTVASSTIISMPTHSTYKAIQRLRSLICCPPGSLIATILRSRRAGHLQQLRHGVPVARGRRHAQAPVCQELRQWRAVHADRVPGVYLAVSVHPALRRHVHGGELAHRLSGRRRGEEAHLV